MTGVDYVPSDAITGADAEHFNLNVDIVGGTEIANVDFGLASDGVAGTAKAFTLTATNTGGQTNVTSTGNEGIATIKDDGTGSIYKYSGTNSATPLTSSDSGYPAQLDDDRPLTVNSITVNEGSPYATFTVTGVAGQLVKLALSNGTATIENGIGVFSRHAA